MSTTDRDQAIESSIWDADGHKLDSKFTLESKGRDIALILHARGGTLNSDYLPALDLLLFRLSKLEILIEDIAVQRKNETRPIIERRLLSEFPRPIRLIEVKIRPLRRLITRQAAAMRGAENLLGGGNPTKRLQVTLMNAGRYEFHDLLQQLSHSAMHDEALPELTKREIAEQRNAAIAGAQAEKYIIEKWLPQNYPQWGQPIDKTDSVGLGYDVAFPDTEIKVEVKGCRGNIGDLRFTKLEWNKARQLKGSYLLVIVTRLDDKTPQVYHIFDPYTKLHATEQIRKQVNYLIRSAAIRQLGPEKAPDTD